MSRRPAAPYIALMGLVLTAVGCTSLAGDLFPPKGPFSGPLITPNPFATATGTPFGPLAPTSMPSATGHGYGRASGYSHLRESVGPLPRPGRTFGH